MRIARALVLVWAAVVVAGGCSGAAPEAQPFPDAGPAAVAPMSATAPPEAPPATLAPPTTPAPPPAPADRPPPTPLPAPSDLDEEPPASRADEPAGQALLSPAEYRYAVLGQAHSSSRGAPPQPTPAAEPGEPAAPVATSGGGFTGGEGGSVFLRNFRDRWVASVGDTGLFDYDEDEARCMANGVHAGVGEVRLAELGSGPDGSGNLAVFSGSVPFTAGEQAAIAAAVGGCIPDVMWRMTGGNGDLGECVRGVLDERDVGLEQLLFGQSDEYQEQVGMAYLEISIRCSELAG